MTSKSPQVSTRSNKGAEIITITKEKNASSPSQVDFTNTVLFERTEKDEMVTETYIRHPYLSSVFTVSYIDDNDYLKTTKKVWEEEAMDRIHPTATIFVSDNTIIGKAGNGKGIRHTLEICERKKLNIPTGQGYHLCDGTHLPENHSESKAVRTTIESGKADVLKNATAYMYGHWWSCIDCSKSMEKAGIKNLILSKEWTKEFLGI